MMTVRKRVGSLSTHRLAVRHSVDYSPLDHFSSNDSSSSSSSETSSDSSADALSDSASRHSSSDHSLPVSSLVMRSSHRLCSLVPSVHRLSVISERPSHDSSSAILSRKRSRYPVASISLSLSIPGALSVARANLLPSPKRIRSLESATDLEGCLEDSFEPYVPREVGLGVDVESSEQSRSRGTDLEVDVNVEGSDEPHLEPKIDPVKAVIKACFDFANIIRASGVDVRVEVVTVARDDVETSMRDLIVVSDDGDTPSVVPEVILEPSQEGAVEGTYETLGDLVQMFHDHTVAIPVHRVQAIESIQSNQGHRIMATRQQSADMLERIKELERDNRRLRDIVDVESQRVTQFRSSELRVQRELR
ncbi:hypothetical protein Tco_1065913 [Tanacetum coccineum]